MKLFQMSRTHSAAMNPILFKHLMVVISQSTFTWGLITPMLIKQTLNKTTLLRDSKNKRDIKMILTMKIANKEEIRGVSNTHLKTKPITSMKCSSL